MIKKNISLHHYVLYYIEYQILKHTELGGGMPVKHNTNYLIMYYHHTSLNTAVDMAVVDTAVAGMVVGTAVVVVADHHCSIMCAL